MARHGAPPGLVGWTLISTLFTELLSRENWLRLMDHVFCSLHKPQMLYIAAVALLHCVRAAVFGKQSAADIIDVCRRQQGIDFAQFFKTLSAFMSATPPSLLVGALPLNKFEHDLAEGVAGGRANDVGEARECLALQGGHALFPLPTGLYPAYDGFPSYIVDWQLRDRKAALELDPGAAAGSQEDILEQLQSRLAGAEEAQKDFAEMRQGQARLEEQARKAAAEKERRQLLELQRIEEDVAKQRLRGLDAAERSAQQQLQALEAARAETEQEMLLSERHLEERSAMGLALQRQREASEQAEATMQAKLSSLHLRRSKEEWVRSCEQGLEEKTRELAARDALLRAQHLKAEEEYAARKEARSRRQAFDKEEEDLTKVHDDMTARMQTLLLAREAEAVDLERQRALRLAREQADEAADASARAQHLLRRHEAAVLLEAQAHSQQRGTDTATESYTDMLAVVRSDGHRQAAEERQRVFAQRLAGERLRAQEQHEGLSRMAEARAGKDAAEVRGGLGCGLGLGLGQGRFGCAAVSLYDLNNLYVVCLLALSATYPPTPRC